MSANAFSELANLPDILIKQVFFRQSTIGLDQAPGEIDRSIAHDTFHVIQNHPYLFPRELRVIEERNKVMNGLLKIDIVLPKGIICIDQEVIAHLLYSYIYYHGPASPIRCKTSQNYGC